MQYSKLFFCLVAVRTALAIPVEETRSVLSARQVGGSCECVFTGSNCQIEEPTPGIVHCRSIPDNTLSYQCPISSDNTYNCNACYQSQGLGAMGMCPGTKVCEKWVNRGEFDLPVFYPCG